MLLDNQIVFIANEAYEDAVSFINDSYIDGYDPDDASEDALADALRYGAVGIYASDDEIEEALSVFWGEWYRVVCGC